MTAKPRDFLAYLGELGKPVRIRYVLVPGYTDGEDDLKALGKLIAKADNLEQLEILPYHELGKVKYEKLGIPYALEGARVPTKDDVERAMEVVEKAKK